MSNQVIDIEEAEHVIDLQFKIVLEWYENRATYHNLKESTIMNELSKEDVERLWIPYVIYDNTDMKEAVELTEGLKTR